MILSPVMMRSMKSTLREHWRDCAFALIAVLLVAAQAVTVSHAAKYGDAPHEHHGAPCIISLVAKAGEKLLTAATIAIAAVVVTWSAVGPVVVREPAPVAIRAARPRGPPTH